MRARLRRLVELEVDRRPDNLRRRGRAATLYVGPVRFYADTSDEGTVGFDVAIPGRRERGGLIFGWEVVGYPERWAGIR